jgi:hypothetical protein
MFSAYPPRTLSTTGIGGGPMVLNELKIQATNLVRSLESLPVSIDRDYELDQARDLMNEIVRRCSLIREVRINPPTAGFEVIFGD